MRPCMGGLALTGAMWATGSMGVAIERLAGIGVIPLWLPSGIALGGLFLLGSRAVPFIWLGSFLISATDHPSLMAAVFATGDLSSAWLGWWLLNRVPGFNKEFRRANEVLWFVLFGALVSSLSATTVGVLSQAVSGMLTWHVVPGIFLTWWLGDASGVLVAAPLLMRWKTFRWDRLRQEGRIGEAAAAYGMMGLLVALLLVVPLDNRGILNSLWSVFSWPLLLWAAMRFGSFGAPSAMFVLAVGNVEVFLRSLHNPHRDPQHALWDQWITTMALSTAGLVVMALEAARTRADEERGKLQAQLAQAQKMESVGRLAGGIAHDFNNLLTVINGHSKLLLGRLGAEDPLRRQLTQVLNAGERAAGLTKQLLAFSRRQVLEARVIDLNHAVLEMRSTLDHLVGDRVMLILDLDSNHLPVLSDVHQMEQMIMHLAMNARDAMPEGGVLRIGTRLMEGNNSAARAQPDGQSGRHSVLSVTDSGTGMDEDTKQKIFDPFFTTKATGGGSGLGLSIVQGVVAQTGGYIEVDSNPGHGTTFRIFLPLHPDETIDDHRPAPVTVHSGRETVLVVEDRSDVRMYVSDVLQSHGYQVVMAADAGEALRLCQTQSSPFDLVLSDVMMEGMNGVDLADRLTAKRLACKVLLMSGYAEQNEKKIAMPKGAYFLQKPFSPEELAEKVKAILAA